MALLTLLSFAAGACALQDGFGQTPVLGFNTYNDVGCTLNESYVTGTINAFAAKGFPGLGYKYFQVDCGWQGRERQANGSITYDSSVLPNGIRPLSQLAISKGMQWSMYTDEGVNACDTISPANRVGSLGYESQDAAMFAAWNAAYVKVDNCYVTAGDNAPKDPRTDFPSRYGTMSKALQSYGIKGMLVCQWGVPYSSSSGLQGPAQWTPPLATSFRVSDDIAQGWSNVQRIMNEAINVGLRNLSGPGSFADMDLLEVGNPGMTFAEQQSHFAIWSTFKSALMVSTNIAQMTASSFGILSNKDLIAINQDSLGVPIKLVQRYSNDYDLFAGPLQNNDSVVLLLDQSNTARTLSVNLAKLGIDSADVKNLWSGATVNGATSYNSKVDAHGSLPLRLSNIRRATTSSPSLTYIEAESGALANGASVASCTGCSGGNKVGNLGGTASLTFNNVKATATTMDVQFDYINCEIGYLGGSLINVRGASVSVNGGAAQQILFPLSGYNWDQDVLKSFKAQLTGFKVGSSNTIQISAASSVTQYAPDIDRIAVTA